MNILLLIPIFLAIVLIRARWVVWAVDNYTATALYWAVMTKQPLAVTKEMSQLWPAHHMLWRLWIWDFRHFVVHQEHYDAMQDFLIAELERNDRGWDIFEEQKPLDKEPPDDTHGPN